MDALLFRKVVSVIMGRSGFGGRPSSPAQQKQQAAPSQNGSGGERKPPAREWRSGLIKLTAWENQSDKGVWYSFVPSRSYRQGDDWKVASSFGADDLLVLAELLKQAWAELNFGASEEGGDTPF